MRHSCDETCIHTIAAKIVNRAYPIDAVSVFWVGDFPLFHGGRSKPKRRSQELPSA
jgi:hypothetical protein